MQKRLKNKHTLLLKIQFRRTQLHKHLLHLKVINIHINLKIWDNKTLVASHETIFLHQKILLCFTEIEIYDVDNITFENYF
jgi:hypothetical protein